MKIAQLPSKRKNLITIIILVIGLPLVVYAAYQVVQLAIRAGADPTPKNVVISNISTSSATISWVTEGQTKGSVVPILNGNEKSPVLDKRGDGRRYTHYAEITSLEPNTKYTFNIISESNKYSTVDGLKFTFTTAPITATVPTPNPVYGSITGGTQDDIIIYIFYKDKSTYPVSTIIPSGGNWIADLSGLRKTSDKELVVAGGSTNLTVFAIAGVDKGAKVEDSYSTLFDSNGKLKDTNTFAISSLTDIYSSFPPIAMLQTASGDVVVDDDDDDDSGSVTPPEDDDDEIISGDRVFRLVMQLQWINMIGGESVTATTGVSSVQVTNLTDTGFTVVWVSSSKEEGSINYGTSIDNIDEEAIDERDGLTNRSTYYVHSVSVAQLQPSTKYYFIVKSGDDIYETTFNTTTFETLASPPPFESVNGIVDNIPSTSEAVVIAYISDDDGSGTAGSGTKMSTLVDENARWILSIADSRNSAGTEYYEYTSGDKLNLSLLSTVDTTPKTESMSGITGRDITITAGGVDTSVDKLSTYGVLGATAQSVLGVDDETPQTGIIENTILIIVVSIILVTFSVIGIAKINRKEKRDNMRKMV
ncbi:MAG: fibronectin type III domain-containing protein [Candidatus Dojkabacteria bacterium]|nr:fibronectin type III domain-containing protein [Candidatus Dojkabacteria bacterium]